MLITKEMMMYTEFEVRQLDNRYLLMYYSFHRMLYERQPNSYSRFRMNCSFQEILKRGLNEKSEVF